MRRRALVSQTRVPEIDRDSGSQRADLYIKWLLAEGWSVTFASSEQEAEERHCRRLRELGVATYLGYEGLGELADEGDFDLALLGFWEPASQALPILREHSPRTRVIVDSVDLHFLRDGRRVLRAGAPLEYEFGTRLVEELNTYQGADAVLAVSEKEAEMLADFLGGERTYVLSDACSLDRSPRGFDERRGILFIGNFRHLPNGEAVEYLCRDVLPRLDRELLAEHPLFVVGSRLDEKVRAHARGLANVHMVGWVPTVEPYLERARVSAVPLLHGAGVKGKIIESLMIGTPVVTTPIGAEGMDLADGVNASVAADPRELAAGLSRLLTDGEAWQRLADAGHAHVCARHGADGVRSRFFEIVEQVMSRPARRAADGKGPSRARRRELAYRETVAVSGDVLGRLTPEGSKVLVVSRGDDKLLALGGRTGWHFPRASDGRWAGYHPADSDAAIAHLEDLRGLGAEYIAIPATSFWWLHHYEGLAAHLDSRYRRVHSDEHVIVFDLTAEPRAGTAATMRADGRRERVFLRSLEGDSPPPAEVAAEIGRSAAYEVVSEEAGDADWTVYAGQGIALPNRFMEEFLGAARELLGAGVERFQPAHDSGPDAGPPVSERLRGVFARELPAPTPIPLLVVRGGAASDGPVALIDAVPARLPAHLPPGEDPMEYSDVGDVFVLDPGASEPPVRSVRRSSGAGAPLISAVISTHERPELLARCLEGFCDQDLPLSDFEVVVVDDGSAGKETGEVLASFAARLPLTWTRIEHAGRSAAKNLAVMIARGDVVLFFDDDDAPAPDLLSEHVRAHEDEPGEATAVLGYTEWDPAIAVTPLMHFITDVDKLMFAYGNLSEAHGGDWRTFWEGRVSSKRSLHLRHGLHDQRLAYSIDIEMAWRLAGRGLEILYRPGARSVMTRTVSFHDFCSRQEAKGRAQAAIAGLHDDPELHEYLRIDGAAERWREAAPGLPALTERIAELEAAVDADGDQGLRGESRLAELHRAYRRAFAACNDKGIAEASEPSAPRRGTAGTTGQDRPRVVPPASRGNGDGAPALTVTMPVWSRTPELAAMAAETIARVWEVASMPTEVVVVDNGSPEPHPPMRARIHRFEENRGVASGWNAGIELAEAPVIAVLNSDCRVEPGWDEALHEAATTGRRIAFPYTDHCDGKGFRRPDQAGTAGWCFMLTRELREEIGTFDERFDPAYVEDTDYWHRAWELGIELSPVPQARVTHARRTSASERADWLLTGHRYLYGWKHGVEPMRAPPFYNREIVDYEAGQGSARLASTT